MKAKAMKNLQGKNNVFNYKLAMTTSYGYISRIRNILSKKEDSIMLLGTYDYDELFKVKMTIPVNEIDMNDLPSPTAHSGILSENFE